VAFALVVLDLVELSRALFLLSSLGEILDLVLDCLDFFPFVRAIDLCLPTLVLLRELSDSRRCQALRHLSQIGRNNQS
jgi:hypothetical protein